MIICDRCTTQLLNNQDVDEVIFNKTPVFRKHFCKKCHKTVIRKLEELGNEAEVDD